MLHRNDYDSIAHLYDRYVQTDIDLKFFRQRVCRCSGRVLELMAGTGRVSKAIFDSNPRLTCVDMSRKMLRGLQNSFTAAKQHPGVVCADVCSLPLDPCYDLAIIPFNSFMELTSTDDQRQALREIHRVLNENGQAICTLHNPDVRAKSLDGKERLLGRFPIVGDQQFELWVMGTLDQETGLAQSRQTFRFFDKSKRLVEEHVQEVRFMLITEQQFRNLCNICGFEILGIHGDYDGSPYDPDASPFLIGTLRKVVSA